VPNEQIIGHDAGDQIVAMLLGVAEEIEVADVEEVESAPERSRRESWLSPLFKHCEETYARDRCQTFRFLLLN
jgi:hypothetical protein